jgi:hypothetical protein
MPPKPTAIVYVDGFNLYYGLLAGSDYKWLDLEALFDYLLPQYEVTLIRYFTARVKKAARPMDPSAPERQKAYLNALQSLPRVRVTEGSFMIHKSFARRRYPAKWHGFTVPRRLRERHIVPIWKIEEKGSDVNLGAYLVLDAAQKSADLYVVVTSDSDLAEPLQIATRDLGARVALSFPHGRRSKELARATHEFVLWISDGALARSQLTNPVVQGRNAHHRPQSWDPKK